MLVRLLNKNSLYRKLVSSSPIIFDDNVSSVEFHDLGFFVADFNLSTCRSDNYYWLIKKVPAIDHNVIVFYFHGWKVIPCMSSSVCIIFEWQQKKLVNLLKAWMNLVIDILILDLRCYSLLIFLSFNGPLKFWIRLY